MLLAVTVQATMTSSHLCCLPLDCTASTFNSKRPFVHSNQEFSDASSRSRKPCLKSSLDGYLRDFECPISGRMVRAVSLNGLPRTVFILRRILYNSDHGTLLRTRPCLHLRAFAQSRMALYQSCLQFQNSR